MFASLLVAFTVFCLAIGHASAQYPLTTLAGTGVAGWTGDGGPATSATLRFSIGVWSDTNGILFVDYSAHVVRRVDNSGIITTIGGTGSSGVATSGGAFTSVQLFFPWGIAGDTAGTNLYISDNYHIWKYTRANGIVSILAGTTTQSLNGDGGPASSADVNSPNGLWLTTSNILYLAEYGNDLVRTINLGTGIISKFAGGGGNGFAGDGGPAVSTSTKLNGPQGIYVDTNGQAFIADRSNSRIRLVAGGIISTYAGGGGNTASGFLATSTSLSSPFDVKGDSMGNIFICEGLGNRVRVVDYATKIATTYLSTGLDNPRGMWYDLSRGKFFVAMSTYLKQADLYGYVTNSPSAGPTVTPTRVPSASPSVVPSVSPTATPSANPSTVTPSVVPTFTPTQDPTATIAPSAGPTVTPTGVPSVRPTEVPSASPSVVPSVSPSVVPSASPTATPSANPSTVTPTVVPTFTPTEDPAATIAPSFRPTVNPTQTSDVVVPPSKQSSSSSTKSLSNGAVAGIVVGVVIGVLLLGVMVFMLLSRRKQNTKVYVKNEAEPVSN